MWKIRRNKHALAKKPGNYGADSSFPGSVQFSLACVGGPAGGGRQADGVRIRCGRPGQGVKEVEIELLVNRRQFTPQGRDERIETGSKGDFVGRYRLPQGTLPEAAVKIRALRPSWQAQESEVLKIVGAETDTAGNRLFQVQADLTLKRQITPAFWIASLVLLVVYILIAAELMHRTLAAFFGAALILFITYTAGTFDKNYFILSFEDAMRAIDLNVIFLLMGMMIIVGVLKKTGLFQWLAYKSYAHGQRQHLHPVLHPPGLSPR